MARPPELPENVVHDYWKAVEESLVNQGMKRPRAKEVAEAYREFMKPAGWAVYNDDPDESAAQARELAKWHAGAIGVGEAGADVFGSEQATVALQSGGAPHALPTDPTVSAILVSLFFDPDESKPKAVADGLFKLWQALNEYHVARGGGILTADDFEQFIGQSVSVPSGST